MLHRCEHSGDQYWRKRGGEDEAGGIAADAIDHLGVGCDVTAHDAERLAQGSFDNVDPVGGLVAFGNTAAPLAIHSHRVNFIDIGQRVVFFCQIANRMDRGDIAIHRIDAFKGDQFGGRWIFCGQQFFQMLHVIVAEDVLLATRIADTGDHAGMVQLVGIDHTAGQQFGQGRQCRIVGNIA